MTLADLLAASAGGLFAWLSLMYAVSSATLYLGYGVTRWSAGLALLGVPLAAAWICADLQRRWLGTALATINAAALLLLSLLLVRGAYDHSWDGASYQQEAIIQMAEGWTDFPAPLPESVRYADWIDTYSKGPWVLAASVYKATGRLESALMLQPLLALAALCLLLAGLLRCRELKAWAAPLLAVPLAFSPVAIYQSLSFYIDGQLVSLLAALIGVGLLLLNAPRRYLLGLLAVLVILAINVKQTGIAFAGLIVLAVLWAVFRLRRDWLKRVFAAAAIGGLLGGLVFGYSPYVINTFKHGHPFYPILGNGDFDIAQGQRPPGFDERNRFERLLVSSFSAPTTTKGGAASLRWPLGFSVEDVASYRGADIRIGGWGVLFSTSLVLGLFVLAGIAAVAKPARSVGLALLTAVAVSVAINPEAWWARYDPQWYFVPLLLAGMALFAHRRWLRALGVTIALLLCANAALIAYAYFPQQNQASQFQRDYLAQLKQSGLPLVVYFGPFPSNRIRLRDAGIPYHAVNDPAHLPCAEPQRIFAHEGLYCAVGGY